MNEALLPVLREQLGFIAGAAGTRARFLVKLADGDPELVTRVNDMTNKDFRVIITLQFIALLNKAPGSFRRSFIDELSRVKLGGLVDDLSAFDSNSIDEARAKKLVFDAITDTTAASGTTTDTSLLLGVGLMVVAVGFYGMSGKR